MSAEVTDLLTMVEDLRILDAVLGDQPDPEVDQDLKLIRDKLDEINLSSPIDTFDEHDVLAHIVRAEQLLAKLTLNSEMPEIFPQNFVSPESLFLSAQNSFLRRLLASPPPPLLPAESGRTPLVVDFSGISGQLHLSRLSEIFVASDARQQSLGHYDGFFTFSLAPDLTLNICVDHKIISDERRPDLLWLLEAEHPRLINYYFFSFVFYILS